MPISEIKVGDTVYAYDELTGEVGEYEVLNVIVHEDDQVAYLTIDNEVIETTPWHLFYTDEGWVEAEDLEPDDLVLSLDMDYGSVDSVVVVDLTQTMYDLTVDKVHTFAVGDGAWIVHNCNLPNGRTIKFHQDFATTAEATDIRNSVTASTGAVTNLDRENMVLAKYIQGAIATSPGFHTGRRSTVAIATTNDGRTVMSVYTASASDMTAVQNTIDAVVSQNSIRFDSIHYTTGNLHAEQQLESLLGNASIDTITISNASGACPTCQSILSREGIRYTESNYFITPGNVQ
ncbi:MAG: polymorphic toxin-type HINT domain-containing protein [Chloroflexota bacterium]